MYLEVSLDGSLLDDIVDGETEGGDFHDHDTRDEPCVLINSILMISSNTYHIAGTQYLLTGAIASE